MTETDIVVSVRNKYGKKKIMCNGKISVDIDYLRVLVNSSLRYALGRATYITGYTRDIFVKLPKEVWDERTLSVAIMDLERYFEDRKNGYKCDMVCDYHVWLDLYDYLKGVQNETDRKV